MNGLGRQTEKEGLKNISFEVARATDYPGDYYDLVAFFDSFHDMGNPVGSSQARTANVEEKKMAHGC